MTEDELAAIEGRANAATPGPWVRELTSIRAPRINFVPPGISTFEFASCSALERNSRDNAEFIAHARTDIPALIAEVRRLHDKIQWFKDMWDSFGPNDEETPAWKLRAEAAEARVRELEAVDHFNDRTIDKWVNDE